MKAPDNSARQSSPGQVITFYSYKGGVGRTMALANVACLLAQTQVSERGVLVIDWDLEAPGLHRFFRDRLTKHFGREQVSDAMLDEHPGLIDLFIELEAATRRDDLPPKDQSEEIAAEILAGVDFGKYIIRTDIPSLSIMKSGRLDQGYASRVNTFQWEALFNRSPYLIRALAEWAAENYQYALIDSRTGETDTSGICTMLLPEKLVVVFTPNRQSLTGVEKLARRALQYRKRSDDLRHLSVFPLPSRIEPSEPELKKNWRENEEYGYQPMFERLFKELYRLEECHLTDYFDEVQIQHVPRYSYGEDVAVLREGKGDRLSLTQSYRSFVERLVTNRTAWGQQGDTPTGSLLNEQHKLAEAAFAQLSPAEQEATLLALTRLVRLAEPNEIGGDSAQQADVNDFDSQSLRQLLKLAEKNLVVIQRDETGNETVRVANEAMVRGWKRLQNVLNQQRDFLLWRQSLRTNISQWKTNNHDHGTLLAGAPLTTAIQKMEERGTELNKVERDYIQESILINQQRQQRYRLLKISALVVVTIGLLIIGVLAYLNVRQDEDTKIQVRVTNLALEASDLGERGKVDEAIDKLNQAINLKPNFADAYLNRGDLLLKKNTGSTNSNPEQTYNSALSDFKQARDLSQKAGDTRSEALALLRTGDVYVKKKDTNAAITFYNSCLSIAPDNPECLLNRATAYQSNNQKDKAIRDYLRVTQVSPSEDLKSRATVGLSQLGAAPSPSPTSEVKPRIFLEYQDPKDAATIDLIAKSLSSFGSLPSKEVVTQPTAGDVRYFFVEDKQMATNIKQAVETFLRQQKKINLTLELRLIGNLAYRVQRGHIEVWLPPLSPETIQAPVQQYPNDTKENSKEPPVQRRASPRKSAVRN